MTVDEPPADGRRLRVSVVVRCFNEEAHIGRLLTGIGHQEYPCDEIIIVDSGSTDRTVEIAREFPVQILEISPSDFSFGRSLNLGCDAATGDVLVFVSAHCYPTYSDWLTQLVRPFEDSALALCYGKQRGGEVTRFSEHRVFEQWFPDMPDPTQSNPFCNNANCAVRRTVWAEHAYDEDLTGLEDVAWAKWALDAGYRVAYVPDAEIIHIHEERPRQILNRYRREAIAFKSIFPHEHFGILDFVRLSLKSILGDARRAMSEGVLLKTAGEILTFRTMQYLGTFLGFAQHGPVQSQLKQKLYYPHRPEDHSVGEELEVSSRERVPYRDEKSCP